MKVRLGNVFERQITGEWGNECSENEPGAKVLRTTNFTSSGEIDFKNVVMRSINKSKVQSKRLHYGDIILEKSGGTEKTPVGRVVFCDESIENDIYLCNNFTQTMRANQVVGYPRYVFYFMWYLHYSGKTDLLQNKTTGIRNLQLKSYLNEELPLPSLDEQRRIAAVRDIAGVYEQMEDWANAYSFYNYAFSLSNNDISLENKASEMNERYRKAQVEEIRRRAAAEPDNKELQEQLVQFSKEAAEQQVAVCRQRVENNPTDPQTRFELGQALFDCGNYTEAIPELQRARNNPHIRIRAMLLLGKCYDAKNMHDMALRQLEEANKELIEMNDTKKEILYMIGLLYEKLGKKEESLAAFQQIYDAEYGYRDVAKRVESSYSN